MQDMNNSRQGHGMTLACGYVYCCAGFSYSNEDLLKSCERFSLLDQKWENNAVPDLPSGMVAPTVITVARIWIYSFGDNTTLMENSNHYL